MKLSRSLHVALFGAFLFTSALAQTEADVASLIPKAQRGNAIAQYRLGLAYSNGQGIATDPIEAYIWLSLAYENGFRGKALGNVAGGLDPSQLETARARLAERRTSLNQKQPAPAKAETAEADIPVVRTAPAPQSSPAVTATTPAPSPALAQELAAAITDKQQLSGELSKSWAETDEVKKQLAEIQATADFLTAETSKLRGERDTLSTKLEQSIKETAAFHVERDSARTLGAQAEQALAQANSQKAALESSLQAAQASAATDKKWLTDELTKSFQEVSTLKSQLEAQTKAVASTPAAPSYPDLSGKVRELEASLSSLAAEANATKQEASRLADDRIEREKQLIALQQKAADLETALSAAKSATPAYPDLRGQVTSLEKQLASVKSEASQAGQQIAALTLAKTTAEKSLAQRPAAPSYPDLSGKVRELEASLASLTTEANATKQEASRLADDRIEREKQLIALQQQSAALADKNTVLQQEAESLRRAVAIPVAPAYPDQREQVAALESQLSTQKIESNQVRQQNIALNQAKLAAEKALAQRAAAPAYPDLSGKVQQLEASFVSLTSEANAAKQEASRLADKNAALQQETENLRRSASAPAAPTYPDLRDQVASLQNQLATLKNEASEASQQIAALTQAKAAAEKSSAQAPVAPAYPDLSGKVQELTASLAALSTEATAAKQEAARLADERIEREKQLIALQQQAESLAHAREAAEKSAAQSPNAPTYPDLSDKVRELESSLAAQTEAAGKSHAALQAQLAASTQPPAPAYPDLSGKVQELTAALAALSSDANTAGKTAEELRSAKTEAEQKLAAAEQARTELAQQFDEFKRSALTNQRDRLSLQSKIQMLESEKAALRQQTAADQTRLADFSSQLAAARRQATEVYPTAPSYPDQRARVEQLEAELTKTNEQANGVVTLLNRSQQEAKDAAAQAEQLRATIRTLENKIAAVDTTPAYPDLRNQVAALETALAAAKSTAPAYPDLREQVSTLEIQLEAARNLPKLMIPAAEHNKTKQELADAKEKLGTTLRGYAIIEKERDELAKRPATSATAAAPAYPDLRNQVAALEAALSAAKAAPSSNSQSQAEIVRLNEAYAALQRANAQSERDLVAARTQLQQLQSASAGLAQPNVPVRSTATPEPVAMRPVPRATITPAPAAVTPPVVASAPAPAAPRRTHVVAGGDSLSKLSQRYYGTPGRWQEIYNANRDVIGSNGALRAGTELRIP